MTEGFALHEIITDAEGQPMDYRFLEINPAFERLTGLKRADLVGHRVREVLPATEAHWIENYGRVALTGEPAHFEDFSAALDRWHEVFAYRPAPRQFAVIFTDITVRRQAEELGVASRVVFTGYQTGDALQQLYANAYVCVHPSEVGGLPIAVLEAMSHGRSVLVSDIAENREAIGEAVTSHSSCSQYSYSWFQAAFFAIIFTEMIFG